MNDNMDRINMVIDYIEGNLCEDIDEEGISRIAGCSFQQFQRVFSFVVGISVGEYVRKRRLTVAAIELRHTRQSIIDIALRFGYDTPSGFTRAFRAHHDATPTEIMEGSKQPHLFSHLFFPSPLYTGNQTFRVDKGEVKMAELSQIEFKSFGPYKVIGRAFKTRLMSNDISMAWGRFFADGSYDLLMELCKDEKNLTPLPDAYTGIMYNFKSDGKMDYLIGIIFSHQTEVPDGFDCFDIPEGKIAEAWVTGEEYEVYSQGHELTVAAIKYAGHEVKWDKFYQCEVYTDERFDKPKKAGIGAVTLDYYIPIQE